MKNRINTAKSRLFASHELYSVVKDQDYQVLVIDAEIDTFGVTIIKLMEHRQRSHHHAADHGDNYDDNDDGGCGLSGSRVIKIEHVSSLLIHCFTVFAVFILFLYDIRPLY